MDKTFLIRWYGSFYGENALDDLKEWENNHSDYTCNLYLIKGYKKYAKTTNHYYIGKTIQGVAKRFSNKDHHIKELPRISEIWVGHFVNMLPDDEDILLAERMLICYVSNEVGNQYMLNRICVNYAPAQNVYILSEWYNYKTLKQRERISKDSIAKIIPDVIAYRVTEKKQSLLYMSEKFKKFWFYITIWRGESYVQES